MSQRIAIFGGTFNPPHNGHLKIAQVAQQQFALDRVIWVPADAPHYRQSTDVAPYIDRAEMVRRVVLCETTTPAIAGSRFCLSTIEQTLTPPIYAIDTFTALQQSEPEGEWFWLIGSDAFQRLPQWYHHADLIPRCTWLVAPRGQDQVKQRESVVQILAERQISLHWQRLSMSPVAISSSQVRRWGGDRSLLQTLVPPAVFSYILEKQLYEGMRDEG